MADRYYYVHQQYLKSLREDEKKQRLHRINRLVLGLVTCMIIFNITLFASFFFSPPKPKVLSSSMPVVKGTQTEIESPVTPPISPISQTSLISPLPQNTPTLPSPTPTIKLKKKSYSIAIIGDSMVDTMGERLEYLEHVLTKKYPGVTFKLYNYGIGGQNVIEGVNRFNNEFEYKDRKYDPLPTLHPDILIVGSFGYNPLTPYDRDEHWLKLAELIQDGKKISGQVYILAEIAPLSRDFGKGPMGINWDDSVRAEHSRRITQQLQNAIGLSRSLKVPLIDTYTPSIDPKTHEGTKKYISPGDGIHPSVEGHEFIANKIVESLNLE